MAIRESDRMNDDFPIGTKVLSIHGEVSCVDGQGEMETGPMAAGFIDSIWPGQEHRYSLAFECGVSVFVSAAELADETAYRVQRFQDNVPN